VFEDEPGYELLDSANWGTLVARADLLINLVRAGAQGDQVGFRRTVEAIVAEERERQHHVVADRLQEFLRASARGSDSPVPEEVGSLVHEIHPRRVLGDLILPDTILLACREVVEEHRRVDLLRSYSLEPRNRILMSGPPGNGKTSLAEALAGELAIPLLAVRYDAVMASFLGETAARLARMFDYVRTRRCVIFFDEFDALGKERGDEHETGEVKRVVSSLLLNIDALPAHVVVITATNHPELLDRAVWRRFQVRLALPPPADRDIARWLERFEGESGLRLGTLKKTITGLLSGQSFAEVEEFFLDVQRRLVLEGPDTAPAAIVRSRIDQWRARLATRP
jgi:AAA+ superfamily predicted ATPase